MGKPVIKWVKNTHKSPIFTDGSIFLVALRTGKEGGPYKWDFDVVKFNCDGDGAYLEDREGNSYDAWSWDDFEYYALLEGDLPTEVSSAVEKEGSTK